MTEKKVLRKCIRKAMDKGWENPKKYPLYSYSYPDNGGMDFEINKNLIFDHDFAKALFGEKTPTCNCHLLHEDCPKDFVDYDWEYHLQQMVISKNPIKYLEKFINNK